ncbi:MAG: Hpt domain-containing protein, partial [Wenzhouxiangella sp.]
LDWAGAVRLAGGDEQLLREVLAAFVPELPGHLKELADQLSAQDREALQRAAHTLKGLAATFGMTTAAESARHLEHGCRDRSDWAELQDLTHRLIEQIMTARPALETICDGSDP